jgi:hypothetical protein
VDGVQNERAAVATAVPQLASGVYPHSMLIESQDIGYSLPILRFGGTDRVEILAKA